MSKIGILLNLAPEMIKEFKFIYNELVAQGHEVIIISSTKLVEELVSLPIPVSYIFSEYFKTNYNNKSLTIPKDYEDVNLWEIIYSDYDRAEFYDELLDDNYYYQQLITVMINFFEEIYQKEELDYIIHENVSNGLAYTADLVGQKRGVQYLGVVYSRLPGRMELDFGLFRNVKDYSDWLNIYNQPDFDLSSQEGSEYIQNYLKKFDNIEPDYMKINNLAPDVSVTKQFLKKDKIDYFIKVLKYSLFTPLEERKYTFQYLNGLKRSIVNFGRKVNRLNKINTINKLYTNPIEGEHFILYPLQFHPEASTSVNARSYVDELNVIRNISFSMPFGYKLYVKDHPGAVGFPSLDFYNAICKLPNVVLVNANYDTKSLIKASASIVTITSTVGFEALILGKPVVLLGTVFYESHPLVYKMKGFDELPVLLKKSVTDKRVFVPESVVWPYYMITRPAEKNYGLLLAKEINKAN